MFSSMKSPHPSLNEMLAKARMAHLSPTMNPPGGNRGSLRIKLDVQRARPKHFTG